MKNGKELTDFNGTTPGRTIAAAGSAGGMDAQYTQMSKTLLKGALESFGESAYNGVMRNKNFNLDEL